MGKTGRKNIKNKNKTCPIFIGGFFQEKTENK